MKISGRVTDALTSLPLENAVVTLYSTTVGPSPTDPTTNTDASGNYSFSFDNVTESYSVTISASMAAYLDGNIQLEVQPENDHTGQNIALSPNP